MNKCSTIKFILLIVFTFVFQSSSQNRKGRNKRQGGSYNHTSFITQALARNQTNKLLGLTFTIIAVQVIKASMFE